jgi:transcriptional regulator with XRE-family HTH domain
MKLLTKFRESQKLSAAELARRAGLSPSQVSIIETGRYIPPRGSPTLRKLNRALGRPVADADDLLREEAGGHDN